MYIENVLTLEIQQDGSCLRIEQKKLILDELKIR